MKLDSTMARRSRRPAPVGTGVAEAVRDGIITYFFFSKGKRRKPAPLLGFSDVLPCFEKRIRFRYLTNVEVIRAFFDLERISLRVDLHELQNEIAIVINPTMLVYLR